MFGRSSASASAVKGLGKERFATLIGERTAIQGDLLLSEGIRIDGQLEGNAHRTSDGHVAVVVGPTGRVKGNIHASRVVVAGTVHGSILAEDDVELHETAVVEGDVQCKTLLVAHGARLAGRILTTEHPTGAPRPVLVTDQGEPTRAAQRVA